MATTTQNATIRKIEYGKCTLTPPSPLAKDPLAWLQEQASDGARLQEQAPDGARLLAHADDGVIWAIYQNGAFTTARAALQDEHITSDLRRGTINPEHFCPELRTATLQQARLFWDKGECHVWRVGAAWHGRRIDDGLDAGDDAYFDEAQLLWGTKIIATVQGFSLLEDGSQGLYHAVPYVLPQGTLQKHEAIALRVRHYLQEDGQTGFNSVRVSRIVGLEHYSPATVNQQSNE